MKPKRYPRRVERVVQRCFAQGGVYLNVARPECWPFLPLAAALLHLGLAPDDAVQVIREADLYLGDRHRLPWDIEEFKARAKYPVEPRLLVDEFLSALPR